MFGFSKVERAVNELVRVIKSSEKSEIDFESMRTERNTLRDEIESLKLKKKREEENIKHLVKMREEQKEVEFERRTMELEKEKQDAIAEVKDKYRDKTEESLNNQIENIRGMHDQILARLPNINVEMSKKL